MKKQLCGVLFLCGLLAASSASAQVVRITKGAADRINIAVDPFTGDAATAQQIAAVVANDLVRSDWFNYVAAANAEYVVRASVAGNAVNGAVFRRGGSAPIMQKACNAESVRAVAHQFADEIVRNVAQKPGIAQTKIAFVANGTGSKELYVMDYDGANVKRLTRDNSLTVRPRFGPNRRSLVFTSYRSGWPDVYFIMDINAPSIRKVASFAGLNTGGAISPDGKRMAVILSKDGNPELYVMNLEGGGLVRLSHTRQAESSPCWSPDGSQICYVSDRAGAPQLFMVPAAGGTEKRVTFGGYRTEPDWAPWTLSQEFGDICYTARMGKQFQIWVMSSKGGGEGHNLTSDAANNEDPTWAPDGRHIVFSKSSNYHKSLYILDAFTGRAIEVNPNLRVLGDCSTPAWSR